MPVHDVEYIWKFRNRIGVHRDYPVPFFLLKLLRFVSPQVPSVPLEEVIGWVLEEWNDDGCWYGRTSITSMAVALLVDVDFPEKPRILTRCCEYLLSTYRQDDDGGGRFCDNVLEDAFLVFNLCERGALDDSTLACLAGPVSRTANRLARLVSAKGPYWESAPPFGGAIGHRVYPTAVMVRALLAHSYRQNPGILEQTAIAVADELISNSARPLATSLKPFWGDVTVERRTDMCFVLMPFDPELTEIYQRCVREPLERELRLTCIRADDISESTQIMVDIWQNLNAAAVVIADLTNRNANVFYELGMAHVLGKPVILISQNMDHVPFDLRPVRTIIYRRTPEGFDELATNVVK